MLNGTTKHILPTSGDRVEAVDAMRGFALLGIIIVHYMEQYYGGNPPLAHVDYAAHTPLDKVLNRLADIFIRGKFFMLFSFLFGLGFFIQIQKTTARGVRLEPYFLRRMAALFLIGILHSLFYRGDILTMYATLGAFLLLFYRLPNRWLIFFAAALAMGLPRIMLQLLFNKASAYQPNAGPWQDAESVYWAAAKYGSFADIAWQNLSYGMKTKIGVQFGLMGRAYQAFCLFLLGIYAGRRRFFEASDAKKTLYSHLVIACSGAWLLLGASQYVLHGATAYQQLTAAWKSVLDASIYDLMCLAQTGVYVGLFMLLWRVERAQPYLSGLQAYGRAALSNYVGQDIIGTALVFGFGLGMLGDVGAAFMLCMALVVFVFQAMASRYWLKRYHYGPLEWVWRSVTLRKWQPWKKKNLG